MGIPRDRLADRHRVGPRAAGRRRHGERPMQKRAVFGGKALPYLLLAPQVIVTLAFFYWPASQAVWQSFLLQDAFGLRTDFVWLENYRDLIGQPDYYRAMATTAVFSIAVAALSLSIA